MDITNLNDEQKQELARAHVARLRDSLPKELQETTFSLNSRLPFKATLFREVLIHRVSDLADVALKLCDAKQLVPAFVLIRATMETTALLCRLHQSTEQFIKTKDIVKYNEFIKKGLLGSRDKTTPEQSYNMTTIVKHLGKEYKGFENMYDALCEYAHPNYSGVLNSYANTVKKEYTACFGKQYQVIPVVYGYELLVGCLELFSHYYDDMADKLKKVNDYFEQNPNSDACY